MNDSSPRGAGQPLFLWTAFIAAACLFLFFYYVYVPLILPFQLILAPALAVIFALTAASPEKGLAFFAFTFPLVNNLPYFFNINPSIPHAPAACVLFLALLLGWFCHRARRRSALLPIAETSLRFPLLMFFGVLCLSGVLSFLRFSNGFPFLTGRLHDLVVNVGGVRAGGAIMSTVFNALNYASGLVFFMLIVHVFPESRTQAGMLRLVVAAGLLVLLFALAQMFISPEMGNYDYWIKLRRINGTFKDPNALGAFCSVLVPLALGFMAAGKGNRRIFYGVVAGLALVVLPAAGSRISFFSLIVSLSIFLGLWLGKKLFRPARRRLAPWAAVAGLGIVAVFLFLESPLFQRLKWSAGFFSGKVSAALFFRSRLSLWAASWEMFKDYPLTGVGLGGYIIELPNVAQEKAIPIDGTDSALNLFFQTGAELGLAGLACLAALFIWLIQRARRGWEKNKNDPLLRPVHAGVAAGFAGFLVNFLFHSHIGSFDVMYVFWLLAAYLAVSGRSLSSPTATSKPVSRRAMAAGIALLLAFGLVQGWNSSQGLSLSRGEARYGWAQDFGFFPWEKDPGGHSFRWSRKRAGRSFLNKGNALVIPLQVSHPDIAVRPVKLRIFFADSMFRRRRLAEEVIFRGPEWVSVEIRLPGGREGKSYFLFEADRDWRPHRFLKTEDRRPLAVKFGPEAFR